MIHRPAREDLVVSMPMAFREKFGTNVAAIVDCFELFIERPSNLYAMAQTWSSYKHYKTAKYLIAITTQCSVSFISEDWSGRASDEYITTKSGFINVLSGDIVLAYHGFNINELIATVWSSIQIPAFTKGKRQLSGKEVDSTISISNVRIHVERVFGAVRQKYTILESTIPINLVMKREGKEHAALDKLVLVSRALTNICLSIASD